MVGQRDPIHSGTEAALPWFSSPSIKVPFFHIPIVHIYFKGKVFLPLGQGLSSPSATDGSIPFRTKTCLGIEGEKSKKGTLWDTQALANFHGIQPRIVSWLPPVTYYPARAEALSQSLGKREAFRVCPSVSKMPVRELNMIHFHWHSQECLDPKLPIKCATNERTKWTTQRHRTKTSMRTGFLRDQGFCYLRLSRPKCPEPPKTKRLRERATTGGKYDTGIRLTSYRELLKADGCYLVGQLQESATRLDKGSYPSSLSVDQTESSLAVQPRRGLGTRSQGAPPFPWITPPQSFRQRDPS